MSRRRDIIRRATELFERKGVSSTSFEDIAKAVGIKREGVYYYFKSRADILLEIILPESSTLLLSMRTIMRTTMSAGERLEAAIESHLARFNPSYLEMSVALQESHVVKNEERLAELRQTWQDYSDLWVKLISDGQESGEFHAELDPKAVAFGILGMCNWVSRWYDPGGPLSIKDITNTFFTLVSRGLVAEEAPARRVPGE